MGTGRPLPPPEEGWELTALGADNVWYRCGLDAVVAVGEDWRLPPSLLQQAKLPAGYGPITVELARQAPTLYGPFTDQRSAAWHAVRERVLTASMVGYILGFSEPGSRKPLGLPSGSWWTSREQTVAYFRRLYGEQQPDSSPPPACLWGCNHEANNT